MSGWNKMSAGRRRTIRCLWQLGCFTATLLALVQAAPRVSFSQEGAAKAPKKERTKPASEEAPLLPSARNEELMGEVKPELFYLRDKSGKILPVPGFTFEDFIKLHRLQKRLDHEEQQPRFSIQELDVNGKAAGDRAELVVEVEIQTRDSGWTRVPLRMESPALVEQPQYDGPGEHLLRFDEKSDGYVVWIRGEVEKPHRLSMKLLVPLATVGG